MAQPTLTNDLNVIANSDLEITYLDGDLNIIQKLDDEPNDVGGLTSAELKAKFDEAGNTIKTYINETLIPELLAADSTEAARAAAEAAREAAETERETAEEGRVSAEEERETAETARANAETARTSAETSRASAETSRQTAETARASAEATRQTQEGLRQSAEVTRSEAETGRVSAESERASAEAARQAQETERQSAETSRAAAETARQEAENARNVWEDYNPAQSYVPGNKVAYQGSSYVNRSACTGVVPTDTTHWLMIARKGEDGDGAGSGDMLKSVYDPASAVATAGGIPAYVTAQTAAMTTHMGNKENPHAVTAAQVGARPDTWTPTAAQVGAIPASAKGMASGVASLDASGKVPSGQLPEISAVHTYTGTIGTTWTEDTNTGVKTQTVSILGVTAAQTAKVDHAYTGSGTSADYEAFVTAENQFLKYITNGYAETVAGGIKFTIFGDANTVSIPIVVEVA